MVIKKNDFLYNHTPIISYKEFYLVYDINKCRVIKISKNNLVKVCDNLKTVKPIKHNYNPKFPQLALCLSFDCNLKCIYCAVKAREKHAIMSKEIIDSALDLLIDRKKSKKIKIRFTGGEPTLHFDKIKYVVNKLSSYNIKPIFVINTNGLVDRDKLDYMINKDFKFFVSLDGTKNINDKQRRLVSGKGSFSQIIATIKYLVKKNVNLVVRCTVTKNSVKNLPLFVNFLSKIGVKIIRIISVNECGRAIITKVKPPSVREFLKYFTEVMKISRKKGIIISNGLFHNLLTPSIHHCSTMGGEELIFSPEGKITTCFEVYKEEDPLSEYFIIGSYNHKKKKFEIDNNRRKFIQNHNVENLKECSKCFCKYICSGGCPLEHYLRSGIKNFKNISPSYCDYSREQIKEIIKKFWIM